PARPVVHHDLAVQAGVVVHREADEVVAQIAVELCLGAEGQAAHVRVQPVGADDQPEGPPGAAAEGHPDAVLGRLQTADRVVEQVFHGVAGGVVQQGSQPAAWQLDVVAGPTHVGEFHTGQPLSTGIYTRQLPRGDVSGPDLRQQAHAIDHLDGDAAQVDRVAAGADRAGLLDHGRPEAAAVQPVRQARPGDAGPGDQHGV